MAQAPVTPDEEHCRLRAWQAHALQIQPGLVMQSLQLVLAGVHEVGDVVLRWEPGAHGPAEVGAVEPDQAGGVDPLEAQLRGADRGDPGRGLRERPTRGGGLGTMLRYGGSGAPGWAWPARAAIDAREP